MNECKTILIDSDLRADTEIAAQSAAESAPDALAAGMSLRAAPARMRLAQHPRRARMVTHVLMGAAFGQRRTAVQ